MGLEIRCKLRDGGVVREKGRVFQRKGPEKANADLARAFNTNNIIHQLENEFQQARLDFVLKVSVFVALLIFLATINIEEVDDVNLFIRSMTDFVAVDDNPIGVGKDYIETSNIPILGYSEYKCTILMYDPPQHISYICDDVLKSRVSIDLEQTSDHESHPTTIAYEIHSRRRSKFFKDYASVMVKMYEDSQIHSALHSLQHLIGRHGVWSQC
ncbi:hypothetical protein HELRODRAFT_168280 [Helobdella robusta]|uniref:Uncharacterized protein n=1 Tax=Helobdella robusta TaxID=6412 RepID=T1F0E4_HELRO|nr:hypothetical protein HELRODRAFT_168280 [Helobdella robusta]ESO09316.1 hypothetical protein HELRODRAFT_168280 [Helobdella robusta]